MTATPNTALTNICGVLVQIRLEQREAMKQQLLAIPGLEIHADSPEGKLVVTVEADDYTEAAEALNQLQTMKGVLSASLIYHHAEELEVTQSESQS
ncbi:chaperone NapD [Thiothrix nivea]|uniref:Chaperone NapD n=1 Tax=Thiothrix nivea (strain ATCC 35100 / DSM 5205 / JP2) TaxID=870187 RepID=A0A656HBW4_THINJ|nr:chaperone NapD [Thiothrix nivea]EIJ33867.1 periplasmic nitrate reductase chaperone NapD [Thiothrix nivea DSM 5205]